jgi:hypothetical protein
MAEHTPGPWVAFSGKYIGVMEGRIRHLVASVEADATLIGFGGDRAMMTISDEQFDARVDRTRQANARLIAAAPGLLEALKTALCDAEGGEVPTQATIDAMNAALTKAEGGQS